jgi:hypothetical protein
MIYIHLLKDLNLKNAEIESVPILREIKTKTPFPLKVEEVKGYLGELFAQPNQIVAIEQAQIIVEQLIAQLTTLQRRTDGLYEEQNIKRALSLVYEAQQPLEQNKQYLQDMISYKDHFFYEMTQILNSLRFLVTAQQKNEANARINELFCKILRNTEFSFRGFDIINDTHTKSVGALVESVKNGFLFRERIEEHVQKLSFEQIKARIPVHELQVNDAIVIQATQLKTIVDQTYQCSMNMIFLAVYLYTYIKWLKV